MDDFAKVLVRVVTWPVVAAAECIKSATERPSSTQKWLGLALSGFMLAGFVSGQLSVTVGSAFLFALVTSFSVLLFRID